MIISNPAIVIQLLIPLMVFYSLIYLISTLVTRKLFSKEDAIASVFGVSMRNLAIALAISMTTFGEKGMEIALIIAVAFMLQPQSAVWYIKLVDIIFKKRKDKGLKI
jgi:predicted Na+-dependent transporter